MSTNKNLLTELETLRKELKSYKRILYSEKELSDSQKRYRESLREKLVEKSGALGQIIENLTHKRLIKLPMTGEVTTIWAEGLSTFPSTYRENSLDKCIDATNEAIGKLKSDIKNGIRDEQGNLIHKSQLASGETPKAFIAHGGDSTALSKLRSFLEALGVQPLIVEEQPSEGRSIGENVDYYAKQADCAIILATKGDIDGKTGKFIPRGNVLIEIGKSQELFKDRIIYLIQAGTKLPTNIDEKVRARFTSQTMGDAFIKIAKELNKFGILKAVKS